MGGRGRGSKETESRRPRRRREIRKTILLVCEGSKTEPNYFDWLQDKLRLKSVTLEIVRGEGGGIKSVVDAAVRLRKLRADQVRLSPGTIDYEEVWCVVDTEVPHDEHIWESHAATARDEGLRLAWSNPCFEYWLLLHFEKTGSRFNACKAVVEKLVGHRSNYRKNSAILDLSLNHVSLAIKHAISIHGTQWRDVPEVTRRNPGTSVHELMEVLIQVSGMTLADFQAKFPAPDQKPPKPRRGHRS